jgi:serine/threonine-protein kinase HipA
MNNDARVILWGRTIGAVSWLDDREVAVFQYTPEFLRSGIQVAPLMMPLAEFPYEFPALARDTFRGLPGLLADSLPDSFGNALIDAWLASQGRTVNSFHPVERLCYVGHRGMGALEFEPAVLGSPTNTSAIELKSLVGLVNQVFDERAGLHGVLAGDDDQTTMQDILRVGTSAGGARAKAILAWNPSTNQFRSGQIEAGSGYEHWLLKFDGISSNRDKELADPMGYGKIEYAYHLMAVEAGIDMMPCRLHHENGRSHFMTKRFDRAEVGDKLHLQSLCAMAHVDYNQSGSTSYEQALQVMKRIDLPRADLEQQVLRAIFNVVGRNQDDHVKNIAFLMNRRGEWRLSPAFDIAYAFNPTGAWTSRHQMSINGKRDEIGRDDLITLASLAGMKKPKANDLIDRVLDVMREWASFADQAGVSGQQSAQIRQSLRTAL